MTQTKIERLKAIKEEFARTQAALVAAHKLEESARAESMATLLENDLEQAELVLAAQDMMHKLQNMAEDLAKMNAQDLFPLVDKMKATFGQEAAHAFEASSQEAITGAMNTVRHAKDEMGNSIMRLEGKVPANDMAADATMDTGAGMDADPAGAMGGDPVDMAMDDFGAADAAAGPEAEPLGRARKESIEGGKSLNESVILEAAGQRLIETEGLDSLIGWVLNEAAAGMPEEHFKSFATSIAQKAAKDPVKLAGWIGKKKHGMAAMAQLAQPTYTQNTTPDLEIMEGKTFKNSDDGDENWDKKAKDKSRHDARKRKGDDKVDESEDLEEKAQTPAARRASQEKFDRGMKAAKRRDDHAAKNDREEVEEGKSFKNSDEDDDNYKKKHSDKNRHDARKRKGDDKIDETAMAAMAVAQLIEASIAREGKGNAAKAVSEATAYLSGKNLVESDVDMQALVLEAFHAQYGMKPAAYSVLKLREFQAPMNPTDKKNAGSAMAKIAGKMGGNPSAGKQSVQAAMQGMDGQERSAANKMLNQMKKDGKAPKNAGEFAANASGMMDDDKDGVNENINAAHWPTDTHGQYKGEPMSTDYGKLKPLSGAPKAGKTEGGASETKVEEPKMDGAKAPESGKPWEKSEEPKAEEPKEESEESKVDESVELDELFGIGKKKAKPEEKPAPKATPRREYTRAEKDRIEQETGVRFF